jgi:hypothetical protein
VPVYQATEPLRVDDSKMKKAAGAKFGYNAFEPNNWRRSNELAVIF